MPDYLTLPEYAAALNISEQAARRACAGKRVDGAVKVGRGWRIPKSAVAPQEYHLSESDRQAIVADVLAGIRRLFGGLA